MKLADLSRMKGLIFAHLNINSIRNKVVEVYRILHEGNIDILGISETNLDELCTSNMYDIDGYTLLRWDRQDHSVRVSGGGLALYIRESLISDELREFQDSTNNLEFKCIKLKITYVVAYKHYRLLLASHL